MSRLNLTFKIFLSMIFGILLGIFFRFYPSYMEIISIEKFKNISSLFLNLIKMICVPLIFFSIISSILSIGDAKKTGIIAFRSIFVFFVMTGISVILGMIITKYSLSAIDLNVDVMQIVNVKNIEISHRKHSFWEFILDIIPNNIIDPFLKANFLQIILIAVIFSISIIKLDRNSQKITKDSIDRMSKIITIAVKMIMEFAPIGIFGIITWLFATQDKNLIISLAFLIIISIFSALILVYLVYSMIFIFILKLNPLPFFYKMLPVQLFGLMTSSSAATLPLAMNVAHNNLGISSQKVNFIIPLGATINMNGGALYFSSCLMFLVHILSIKFTIYQYCTAFFICVLSAVGTAPVPGSAILMLSGVISMLGLPIETIGIFFAIDRILDMIRTFVNISGDVLSSLIVDRIDKTLDIEIYKK